MNVNKHKWFLVLIAISMLMLIGSAAGCGPTSFTKTTAKPTINSFAASPTSISAGQRTTISWDVSGATAIDIQPEIGTVGASGSLLLSPPAGITYTLTATNQAGSATSSVTVTVTPVVTGKPDLVITDVWLAAETIYYKVKNQGTADTKPSSSRLYVNGFEKDSNYIDVLAAGQEKIYNFARYQHLQQIISTQKSGFEFPAINIKICADEDNTVAESNEDNNCLSQMWGLIETYDFLYNAHLAKWRSSAGDLRWGGLPGDKNGAAFIFLDDLTICPPKVSNGWILGKFSDFYSEQGISLSRELEVPENAKFTAELGFRRGENSTDGVRVALGYLDDTFSMVFFPKMDVYSDGELHTYKVDLSALAGKKTEFFLWVEAKDSPEGDCVKWVNPRITQE